MRLKIFIGLLMSFFILALSGCGEDNKNTDVKKVGTLTRLNIDAQEADKLTDKFNSEHGEKTSQHTTYYDNLNSMQMGLSAGNIDEIKTYKSVADYVARQNSDFAVKNSGTVPLYDNFCCALREDETQLRDEMNVAIESMKADGTLEKLTQDFITNLQADEIPPAVKLPKFDGAPVIKVGVTGDLPPLDLILPDGTPAGFNTAVLAEIAKRINKNIELVNIDSNTRAAALTSGQVDAVFWVVVPEGENPLPKDSDQPAGVTLTDSYYKDQVADITLSSAVGAIQ